jgi:cell division protease FtsH
MSYDMILNYGLNETIGNVSYHSMMNETYNRPFSDQTAWLVDQEVKNMIEGQYTRAQNLLKEHRTQLDALAAALLEKEVLHRSDLEEIIGKRPFADAHSSSPEEQTTVTPEVEQTATPSDSAE